MCTSNLVFYVDDILVITYVFRHIWVDNHYLFVCDDFSSFETNT